MTFKSGLSEPRSRDRYFYITGGILQNNSQIALGIPGSVGAKQQEDVPFQSGHQNE